MKKPYSKIPLGHLKPFFQAGWSLVCLDYTVAVGIALLELIVLGFSVVRGMGPILAGMIGLLLLPGILHVGKDWVEGRRSRVGKLLIIFQEKGLMERFVSFLLLALLVLISQTLLKVILFGLNPLIGLGLGVAIFISNLLLMISAPLIVFRKKKLGEALFLSLKALFGNLFFYLFAAVGAGLGVALGGIFLFLPLVLIVMPALVPLPYLLYAMVFKGLKVEAFEVGLREQNGFVPEDDTSNGPREQQLL